MENIILFLSFVKRFIFKKINLDQIFPFEEIIKTPLVQEIIETPLVQETETIEEEREPLTLKKVCHNENHFNYVMKELVERGMIAEHTYIWIDHKSGYKTTIIVLIKLLRALGYYHLDYHLSNKDVIEIALNSFHEELKIDLVKHTNLKTQTINYIPLAATLVTIPVRK